ncbi:hypothetical protein PG995_004158 [Apiospora arundinis]
MESIRLAAKKILKQGEIRDLTVKLRDLDERLRVRLSRILDVKHHSSINGALDNLQRQSIALGAVLSRRILSLQASVLTELEDTSSNVLKLKNSLETLAEESKNSVEQLRFLKSLRFPELQNRYSAIMDAHTNTLDWAFDESKSKLVAWLREGSGIFWATGLAGSGKSTFMKLIATHDTTRDLLQTWASGSRMITGNYFFWNLGSAMQKSQQGLLQSLLFQILRQDLELIPILCPGRDTILPWTKTELCKVFEQLSCTDLGDRKFCFFIDGLDEYEGEEEEVIQVISQLATSPHIKICTSSRPWNAFRYAFGETEYTLSLQDLTAKDIAAYVDAELINHPAFKKCVEEDERFADTSRQITSNAKGVWLWVYLIVMGLKRDLKSPETFELWQKRIDSLPPTLEEVFRRMLARLDPIHKVQTAQIFLLMLAGEELEIPKFSLDIYIFLEKGVTSVEDLRRIPFRDFASPGDLDTYRDEQRKTDDIARSRLNDRCRDLLHVIPGDSEFGPYRNRLEFLHRTARDFLRDTYYNTLQDNSDNFCMVTSLAYIFMAMIKAHPLRHRYLFYPDDSVIGSLPRHVDNDLCGILRDFWGIVSKRERYIEVEDIDEFDRLASRRVTKQWVTLFHTGLFDEVWHHDEARMLAWCLCMRLNKYVGAKWNKKRYALLLRLQWSPLRAALPSICRDCEFDLFPTRCFSAKMLTMLFTKKGSLAANEPHFDPVLPSVSAGCLFLHNVSTRQYVESVGDDPTTKRLLEAEGELFAAAKLLFENGLEIPEEAWLAEAGLLSDKIAYNITRSNFRDRLAPVFGEARASLLEEIYNNTCSLSDKASIGSIADGRNTKASD